MYQNNFFIHFNQIFIPLQWTNDGDSSIFFIKIETSCIRLLERERRYGALAPGRQKSTYRTGKDFKLLWWKEQILMENWMK